MLIFSRYSWWAAAALGLAVVLTLFTQVGLLGPIRSIFLTVTQPFEEAVAAVARPVAGVLGDAGDLRKLRDENQTLRLENEQLHSQVALLQEDAGRAAELEEALKITQGDSEETRLAANVVSRQSTPFTDVLSIDRGSNDGVRAGMVVTSAKGSLMGLVTEVFANRSVVRLITDSKSRVAAEDVETGATGSVRGDANRTLTFALPDAAVNVGDVIQTSSISGRFPPGIPIGRVTELVPTEQGIPRSVRVEPLVRISTARTVLVLTSFIPDELAP
ncbi:MAG: rod shape-determining protein MreC [Dehalococcoidia bacterium]